MFDAAAPVETLDPAERLLTPGNRLTVAPVLTDDVFERAAQRQRRSVIHNEPIEAAPIEPVYRDFDDKPMYPSEKIGREIMRLLSEGKSIATSPDPLGRIGAEVRQSGRAFQNIIGLGDGERQQTWLERMIRSAATLPGDVVTGAEPIGQTGDRFSPHIIERAQELAGLSGGAPLMAKPGSATLGAGMTRQPLYHWTDSVPQISTNEHRLIPNSMSLGNIKPIGDFSTAWGKNGYKIEFNGKPNVLEVDLKGKKGSDFYKFGKEEDTPIGRGQAIYDYAITNGYDVVKIRNVPGVGTEHAVVNPAVIKGYTDKNGAFTAFSDTTKPALAIEALKGQKAEPFYSAVEAAVRGAPDQVMTPEQWSGYLRNRPGVKAEELDWIGLPEGQKVSKQQMLDHAKEHGVQMKEVRKEGSQDDFTGVPEYAMNEAGNKAEELLFEHWLETPANQRLHSRDADKAMEKFDKYMESPEGQRIYDEHIQHHLAEMDFEPVPEAGQPKFSEYQLPGGDNYREMLFTLPKRAETELSKKIKIIEDERIRLQDKFGSQYGVNWWENAQNVLSADELRKWQSLTKEHNDLAKTEKQNVEQSYQSSHWDEPNVLAHARMNDRTLTEPGFVAVNKNSGNRSKTFRTQEEANAFVQSIPEKVRAPIEIMPGEYGTKTLHLEELQSDWHQAGRKQGYKDSAAIAKAQQQYEDKVAAARGEYAAIKSEIQKLETQYGVDWAARPGLSPASGIHPSNSAFLKMEADPIYQELFAKERAAAARVADVMRDVEGGALNPTHGVPDAPFKTSWPDLVLKRMIREAAENGYDAVSWTPGEAQAARYELSRHVNQISAMRNGEGYYNVYMEGKDGFPLFRNRDGFSDNGHKTMTAKQLEDMIGKNPAKKLIEGADKKSQTGDWFDLKDEGLKVGGEGMKGFYDDMLVRKANALGKKYGAKVEWKEIPTHDTVKDPLVTDQLYDRAVEHLQQEFDRRTADRDWSRSERERHYEKFTESPEGERIFNDIIFKGEPIKMKIPVLRLTPELKDVAMRRGFPLFSAGVPYPLIPVDHDPFKETK